MKSAFQLFKQVVGKAGEAVLLFHTCGSFHSAASAGPLFSCLTSTHLAHQLSAGYNAAVKPAQFNAAIHAAVFVGFGALGGNAILNANSPLAFIYFAIAAVVAFHGAFSERRASSRKLKAREGIGQVLEGLAACELRAYSGSNASEYDALLQELDALDKKLETIARVYLNDPSIASRYKAVNVLDIHLDDATRLHFLSRAQGSFWSVYQKIKGQRAALGEIMKELD